jgi:hypothetical protein
MAYGFQDCCNLSSYFYLTGIPASVQENEIFKIETLQGETFCGTYVKVPPLNYSVPTYTVISLTEYSSCDDCEDLGSNPCPAEESIFLSQFGSGTVATSTDCYLKTIFPLYVDCSPSITPTSEATSDGQLILYVIGGVPPYFFYSAGTFATPNQQLFSSTPGATVNSYLVLDGIAQGEYSITVTDAQGNFFEDVTCIIDAQPVPATLTCAGTVKPSMSFNGVGPSDGSVSISIAGGVPPYLVQINSTAYSQTSNSDGVVTFTNLPAGSYTFTVTETAEPPFPASVTSLTCTISLGPEVFYPQNMCLSFFLCNQTNTSDRFYLNLVRDGSTVYNFRPVYKLTPQSAAKIGLLVSNTFRIRWVNDTIGWGAVGDNSETINIDWNTEPSECTFSNPDIFNISSIFIGEVSFAESTPTDFSWAGAPGLMNQATSVQISDSNCEVISYIDSTTDQFFICNANNSSEVQIPLGAVGGNGGPYTYQVYPPGGGPFSIPVLGNILTLTDSNSAGVYTVYAFDESGAQSTNVTTFTLTYSCFGLTVIPNTNLICDNYENIIYGNVIFDVTIFQPISAGAAATIDYPVTLFWRKTTATIYNTVVMFTNTTTVTVQGSFDGTNAENFGAGTYEFYIEDNNGESSIVVFSTLNSVPCPNPIKDADFNVNLTECGTELGSVSISWAEGLFPVTLFWAPEDFAINDTWDEILLSDVYTYDLLDLNPGTYQFYLQDSFNIETPPLSFTIPLPPAVNIRIRTASALATAMLPNGEYQTGVLDVNELGPERYYNTSLFDIGREVEDFSLYPQDSSGPAASEPGSVDYMGRDGYIMNSDDDIFAGPRLPSNSVQQGIWRYPLLIEMFIDYTENDTPLMGWFEIKTKVQNVYTSQVPAGLYTLDRLLVFRDYLEYNDNYLGKAWNEYVWLNDFDYQYDPNGGPNLNSAEQNIMGYPGGLYYDFTPDDLTGNYPYVTPNFIGLNLNGVQQPPTTFPRKKVDLTTFGDDPGEFCESNTVYSGENPWKWSDQLSYNNTPNLCTAISNFSVNFQKVQVDATLPTVNSNLVDITNCKNYFTNFAATFADQLFYNYAFAYESADIDLVGPFTELWDNLEFLSINSQDGYYETFEYINDTTGNGNAYTATLNNAELNGLSWNQQGKDIFLENFNGTSVIERTFTFGSEDGPLTINGNTVDGINYSSVGLKLEWFAVYQAYEQFCCGQSGEEPTLNNCQSAKGLQVEVIFHPTNIPKCPTSNIPQQVKYFFRNPSVININGDTAPDLTGIQVGPYVTSMKVVGGTSNRPNLFGHLSNEIIIDI